MNTIVIMADSWRFDYLGCYGNDWIKTPNIDKLAAEGMRLLNFNVEARCTPIYQETGNLFLRPARRRLLARRDEHDHEVCEICMADEVFGPVDDPVVTVSFRCALHATHVRTGVRFRHGKCVEFFAADGGQKVTFALLAVAGGENAGRPAEENR